MLGEKQMIRSEGIAVTSDDRRYLHDPAGADLNLDDVLWACLTRSIQVITGLISLIHCKEWDIAFDIILTTHLTAKGFLVNLDCQQKVGALHQELRKNAILGMQKIWMKQHDPGIQLAKQLFVRGPLIDLAGGEEGLEGANH
jgi:hypothetical protein